MDKKSQLTDGREIVIRNLHLDDLDESVGFFRALPEEDRAYLRVDVTDRDIVAQRIQAMDTGRIRRLVAEIDGTIVADGSLEVENRGWKDHIAELRLIVARPLQSLGLGKHLARELYLLAAEMKVEQIVVKFMRPQKRAQSIFKKLGFHQDAVFEDYVKDIHGDKHDLIVMRCDLNELWEKLGNFMEDSDWVRTR
ncbi:MAG: GNAT family N-acetyltransferase [FCB group bacterium]|nr:GNAT family N-acetyltransferase [FCB group bacterium]